MLELNGLKCWVTTSDLVVFPATLTPIDSTRIAACTVRLPSNRKSFIIHWSSTTPITAWCEVNLKNSLGKVNAGVVKCEMDANHPATQKRSTQEYRGVSGRNLAFGGRRLPTSGNLGAAWVEIRRATAIEVNEVSTLNKKLTITWVASDHPDSGSPFVTFIINFELDEPTSGTILSSPGVPSASRSSVRRESTEEKAENGVSNPDSSNGDFGEFMSPAPTAPAAETGISDPTAQDSDVFFEAPNGSGAQKRGREDSQSENNTHELKRSRMEKAVIPTTPVHNPKTPEIPSSKVPDWMSGLRFNLAKPLKIVNTTVPKLPGPLLLGPIPQIPLPEMAKTPIQRTHTETTLPETPAIETPTQTQLPEVPTPQSSIQTQPDAPTPQTPNQPQSDVVDSTTPVPNTEMPQLALELSDDEGDDFESKIAILETEIETYTKELGKANEKEKFMVIKRQSVQSITDIKSLEAVCGPIPSKTPTHENWDLINNEISDDESGYGEKAIYMEETLPSLERYRTALEYKKIYIEKKTMLKRMKKDVHDAKQRCGEISADIIRIISTPRKTPS